MLRVWLAALAGAGVWLCACSGTTVGGEGDTDVDAGGKGGSAPAKPASSPPKQCESYVNGRCEKSFGCYVKVGRLPQKDLKYNVDQCEKLLVERLPCAEVQSIGAGYSSCLSEMKAMACSSWDVEPAQFPSVALPASCGDVIYF